MRVTLFDYGAGNLHSLAKALETPGVEIAIETDPVAALATDALVLPGVGAFGAAAKRLEPGREAMREALADGLPCVAICLGMQLLFDGSAEGGGRGLGLVHGTVRRLRATRTPHMGWNGFERASDPQLAASGLASAYFAHSFVCAPADPACVTAWTVLEQDGFPAIVRRVRTVGVQFHPEKSSLPGVAFLRSTLAALLADATAAGRALIERRGGEAP